MPMHKRNPRGEPNLGSTPSESSSACTTTTGPSGPTDNSPKQAVPPPRLAASVKESLAPKEGQKDDQEKARADLLLDFSRALLLVARVSTYGAERYSPGGWRNVPSGQRRYTAALLRHLLAEPSSTLDESGFPHAAHVAWNALARLELLLSEGERHELG